MQLSCVLALPILMGEYIVYDNIIDTRTVRIMIICVSDNLPKPHFESIQKNDRKVPSLLLFFHRSYSCFYTAFSWFSLQIDARFIISRWLHRLGMRWSSSRSPLFSGTPIRAAFSKGNISSRFDPLLSLILTLFLTKKERLSQELTTHPAFLTENFSSDHTIHLNPPWGSIHTNLDLRLTKIAWFQASHSESSSPRCTPKESTNLT